MFRSKSSVIRSVFYSVTKDSLLRFQINLKQLLSSREVPNPQYGERARTFTLLYISTLDLS